MSLWETPGGAGCRVTATSWGHAVACPDQQPGLDPTENIQFHPQGFPLEDQVNLGIEGGYDFLIVSAQEPEGAILGLQSPVLMRWHVRI